MTIDTSKLEHMDIVDMPSDPNGYLGTFRATLRGTYNANRNNPSAIKLIRDTLEFALSKFEAAEAVPAEDLPLDPPAPDAPEKQTSKAAGKAKLSTRTAQR